MQRSQHRDPALKQAWEYAEQVEQKVEGHQARRMASSKVEITGCLGGLLAILVLTALAGWFRRFLGNVSLFFSPLYFPKVFEVLARLTYFAFVS